MGNIRVSVPLEWLNHVELSGPVAYDNITIYRTRNGAEARRGGPGARGEAEYFYLLPDGSWVGAQFSWADLSREEKLDFNQRVQFPSMQEAIEMAVRVLEEEEGARRWERQKAESRKLEEPTVAQTE